jgi:hypothetical protein
LEVILRSQLRNSKINSAYGDPCKCLLAEMLIVLNSEETWSVSNFP